MKLPGSNSNKISSNQWTIVEENELTNSTKKYSSYPISVDKEQLLACRGMSQLEAAKKLGVSVSTLKRRYYELHLGKWPCYKKKSKAKGTANHPYALFCPKIAMAKLMRESNVDEKAIDKQTEEVLYGLFSKPQKPELLKLNFQTVQAVDKTAQPIITIQENQSNMIIEEYRSFRT